MDDPKYPFLLPHPIARTILIPSSKARLLNGKEEGTGFGLAHLLEVIDRVSIGQKDGSNGETDPEYGIAPKGDKAAAQDVSHPRQWELAHLHGKEEALGLTHHHIHKDLMEDRGEEKSGKVGVTLGHPHFISEWMVDMTKEKVMNGLVPSSGKLIP